ncbi:MAG: hypothetical protein ABSD20_03950 [Terriglobales bacterium]|jgi:hypothetical protein
MNTSRLFAISTCLVLLCVLFVPNAKADEWSQATKLTFSQSVEVPGRVLGAGTYWFALLDDRANRNVVQIWSEDRTHLIATVLANPDYRMEPTGEPVIKFAERESGRPEAIEAWFYPGDQWGHEFVYPATEGYQVAENVQPVASSIREEAPVQTVETAAVSNPPEMQATPAASSGDNGAVMAQNTQSEPVQASAANPGDLPQTASRLPLWGLLGVLSLGTALILRGMAGA